MTEYRNHRICVYLKMTLVSLPVVLLTGMRQSGIRTSFQRDTAVKGRRYVSRNA